MAKSKRKSILNAALKALLEGAETSALIKIPATFISELAALPDEQQKVLTEFLREQSGLLTVLGTHLHDKGLYDMAEPMFRKALVVCNS